MNARIGYGLQHTSAWKTNKVHVCRSAKLLSYRPSRSRGFLNQPFRDSGGLKWQRQRQSQSLCRAGPYQTPEIGDRILAAAPYVLPLMDSFPFGKFVLIQYPFILRAMAPLVPIFKLYTTFPFASFLIFIAVYSGVVNNYSLSRFVRYNALQAVLLDILLIIPQVLTESLFKQPTDPGLSLQLYVNVVNAIFLFVGASVAYGVGASLVGQYPRLPLVADAADSQLRDGPSGW